jgi:phenylpropionate dioxygenase-like ring-hydroxylating dioxygenase large terminal subunit
VDIVDAVLVSELPGLRRYFHPVARAVDVADAPVRAELFGQGVVVWRGPDGTPAAALDECPHRAARLSMGWCDHGNVVCPYHGWAFDPDGRNVLLPQLEPGRPTPPKARLATLACAESFGLVWVCVEDPVAPPPLPPRADAGYEWRVEFVEEWAASAPRVVDNSLDISHVAFVHRGTIGDPGQPGLSGFTVERHDHGLAFHLRYVSKVNEQQKRNLGIDADYAERDTTVDLVQPLAFTAVLGYANGVEHVLFKGASPIDDRRSLFWQVAGRNDTPDEERWASIIAMDRAVTLEDRPILEGIRPDIPVDVTTEVHTRADRMTMEYRRVLASLAADPVRSPGG